MCVRRTTKKPSLPWTRRSTMVQPPSSPAFLSLVCCQVELHRRQLFAFCQRSALVDLPDKCRVLLCPTGPGTRGNADKPRSLLNLRGICLLRLGSAKEARDCFREVRREGTYRAKPVQARMVCSGDNGDNDVGKGCVSVLDEGAFRDRHVYWHAEQRCWPTPLPFE